MTIHTLRPKRDSKPVSISVTPDGLRCETFSDGSKLLIDDQGVPVGKVEAVHPYLARPSTKTS